MQISHRTSAGSTALTLPVGSGTPMPSSGAGASALCGNRLLPSTRRAKDEPATRSVHAGFTGRGVIGQPEVHGLRLIRTNAHKPIAGLHQRSGEDTRAVRPISGASHVVSLSLGCLVPDRLPLRDVSGGPLPDSQGSSARVERSRIAPVVPAIPVRYLRFVAAVLADPCDQRTNAARHLVPPAATDSGRDLNRRRVQWLTKGRSSLPM